MGPFFTLMLSVAIQKIITPAVLQFLPMVTSVDPVQVLINSGILGVVVVAAMLGYIRFKPEVDRLYEIIDQQADVITAYQSQTMGHTLPALARTSDLIQRAGDVTHNEVEVAQQLERLVSRLEGVIEHGKRH